MRRSRKSSRPICAWCGIRIEPETGFRGYTDEYAEFQGTVGVIICTPACPQRPEGAVVAAVPEWRQELVSIT